MLSIYCVLNNFFWRLHLTIFLNILYSRTISHDHSIHKAGCFFFFFLGALLFQQNGISDNKDAGKKGHGVGTWRSPPHSSVFALVSANSLKALGNGLERGGGGREKEKRRERGRAHNQSPEPTPRCVCVCARVATDTVCPAHRMLSVKTRTVLGKEGQLVTLNVHTYMCV